MLSGAKMRAVLTPVSRGLRERLARDEILEMENNENSQNCSPTAKAAKRDTYLTEEEYYNDQSSTLPEGLDMDDEASWDALRKRSQIIFKYTGVC